MSVDEFIRLFSKEYKLNNERDYVKVTSDSEHLFLSKAVIIRNCYEDLSKIINKHFIFIKKQKH